MFPRDIFRLGWLGMNILHAYSLWGIASPNALGCSIIWTRFKLESMSKICLVGLRCTTPYCAEKRCSSGDFSKWAPTRSSPSLMAKGRVRPEMYRAVAHILFILKQRRKVVQNLQGCDSEITMAYLQGRAKGRHLRGRRALR